VEAAVGDVVAAGRPVILDVTDLEFIDCAALGTLLRCQALPRAAGADLLAAAPGGMVMRLLTLAGMENAVWVYATVAAAVAATCDGTGQ
jgi:anti-anti-sigma factor